MAVAKLFIMKKKTSNQFKNPPKFMNKAVFLDRDGVINEEAGYITSAEQLKIIDSVPEAIQILNEEGFKVIVVTNQPQVARGLCSEEDIKNLHERLSDKLMATGAKIDAFYFCPHHPEKDHPDIPGEALRYRIHCSCRKPETFLFKKAAEDFDIDLKNSFLIGDRSVDVKAGENIGCKTFLVKTGSGGSDFKYEVKPDFIVDDLMKAAKLIRKINSLTTVILAGGKGERLRPLTNDMPKPMMLINKKPLLEHLVELNRSCGINRIIISGHYLFDKIKDYFGDGNRWGVQIEYIDDGEKPLGSGGALKKVESFLPENFIVMSGDVITNFNLWELIKLHFNENGLAAIVVRETDHPEDSDLIQIDDKNRAFNFFMKHEVNKVGNVAHVGLFIFQKNIFDFVPQSGNLEHDVLQPAIKNSNVFCYLNKNYYIKDIGTPERYASAEEFFSDSI